jgi:hypothetical protein
MALNQLFQEESETLPGILLCSGVVIMPHLLSKSRGHTRALAFATAAQVLVLELPAPTPLVWRNRGLAWPVCEAFDVSRACDTLRSVRPL